MIARRGQSGHAVREVQEWLCYWGSHLVIDGVYGAVTEALVREFQVRHSLQPSGVVDDATWSELELKLRRIRELPPEIPGGGLNEIIAMNALRHLSARPREIGGQNRGPWVRYYMRGGDGPAYLWCAGAVSTIVLQAYEIARQDPAGRFAFTQSCDRLLEDAQRNGTLALVPAAGNVFLVPRAGRLDDCIHAGIVLRVRGDGLLTTIEGNTNDDGSRDGYEMCSRSRSAAGKYFIDLEA